MKLNILCAILGIVAYFALAVAIIPSSRKSMITKESVKYSTEVKVTGEYTERGKEIIVLTINDRKFVGIKGYGLVEIK